MGTGGTESQVDQQALHEARGVLLPALAGSQLPDAVRRLLAGGGRTVLLGESRDEYVTRRMSDERRRRESPQAVRELIGEARELARAPLVVAVDHELGGIQRFEALVDALPSAREATAMDVEELETRCHAVGLQLRELGVDLVLAPILDVASINPWLDGRLLVGTIDDVARVGAAFVVGMQRAGLACCAKHFPGHRGLDVDPMVAAEALVQIEREQVLEDLTPFRAAVAAGARSVMVGPGTFPAIGGDAPAIRSPQVLELLRSISFDGVVLSDDLDAPSVTRERPVAETAVDALAAGNDLLLVSADGDLELIADTIAAASSAGRLPEGRLADAADRVDRLARRD